MANTRQNRAFGTASPRSFQLTSCLLTNAVALIDAPRSSVFDAIGRLCRDTGDDGHLTTAVVPSDGGASCRCGLT